MSRVEIDGCKSGERGMIVRKAQVVQRVVGDVRWCSFLKRYDDGGCKSGERGVMVGEDQVMQRVMSSVVFVFKD
ncbi:unnamed protein product [Camellia sinensis]